MYHTLAANWEALTKGRFGFSSFILTGLKRYLSRANRGSLAKLTTLLKKMSSKSPRRGLKWQRPSERYWALQAYFGVQRAQR